MKYVIRKVPERDTSYLERILPDALIYCDTEHKGCRYSFEQALLLANDDAVYVQDDMILCRDFRKRAEKYIKKYPSHCIVFSNTTYGKDSVNVIREGFWDPVQAPWLMCTYIPKEMAKAFIFAKRNNMFKVFKNAIKYDFDDVEWGNFLAFMNEKVFVTVPNLAGHPRNKSVTGFSRTPRICINFDYNDAER